MLRLQGFSWTVETLCDPTGLDCSIIQIQWHETHVLPTVQNTMRYQIRASFQSSLQVQQCRDCKLLLIGSLLAWKGLRVNPNG